MSKKQALGFAGVSPGLLADWSTHLLGTCCQGMCKQKGDLAFA